MDLVIIMSSDGAAGSPLGSGAIRAGTFSGSIAGCSPVGGLASGPRNALSPQPCKPRTTQHASASSGSPALIQAITHCRGDGPGGSRESGTPRHPLAEGKTRRGKLVDPRGFEPLTYRLPVCRAPNCATGPRRARFAD